MGDGGLGDADLPGLFRAADAASLRGQRRQLVSLGLRLVFVVAAAAFGAVSFKLASGVDLAALLVALFFVGALLVERWQAAEKPGTTWYDGRALAESAKSMAWRYAVRALPYNDDVARPRLIGDLRRLLEDMPDAIVLKQEGPPVTEAMERARVSGLNQRRATYINGRLDHQRDWYKRKSLRATALAGRWRLLLSLGEIAGITLALARALDWINVDAPGVMAALIGAGAAWLATRAYELNARAYAVAAQELEFAREELAAVTTEAEWAGCVADAEEAISREHTMWRASRCSQSVARIGYGSPRADVVRDPPAPGV